MPKNNRQLWAEAIRQGTVGRSITSASALGGRPVFRGRILGVDPSLRGTGLAMLECAPPAGPLLLGSTTVRNPSRYSQTDCLRAIAERIEGLLREFQPDTAAVEEAIYVQNYQTALILGLARGAVLTTLARAGLAIHAYAPLRIKQAVTGHGRASKAQVAGLLKTHLKLVAPLPLDESDAAAAALCHIFTAR